jgi:hypothetical protein
MGREAPHRVSVYAAVQMDFAALTKAAHATPA